MMHQRSISFPGWKLALAGSGLTPLTQAAFTREILGFLRHCRTSHSPATNELAKTYLLGREQQGGGPAREALRWFYREGRRHAAALPTDATPMNRPIQRESAPSYPPGTAIIARAEPRPGADQPVNSAPAQTKRIEPTDSVPTASPGPRPMEPPAAVSDLGRAPWERDLIRTSRERHFLWRTEQTYREWGIRFARFIAPRTPYAADGEDVAAFLSVLAVEGRASPSTQKQALNALVFLMQEALHRDLGKMNFQSAHPNPRVPTVLSTAEMRSLLAQMRGTTRLMAELAYGSGLRLMELLRLRIHHLDLDRGRLQVMAGKGDKDRVTVLAGGRSTSFARWRNFISVPSLSPEVLNAHASPSGSAFKVSVG